MDSRGGQCRHESAAPAFLLSLTLVFGDFVPGDFRILAIGFGLARGDFLLAVGYQLLDLQVGESIVAGGNLGDYGVVFLDCLVLALTLEAGDFLGQQILGLAVAS